MQAQRRRDVRPGRKQAPETLGCERDRVRNLAVAQGGARAGGTGDRRGWKEAHDVAQDRTRQQLGQHNVWKGSRASGRWEKGSDRSLGSWGSRGSIAARLVSARLRVGLEKAAGNGMKRMTINSNH